MNNRLTLEGLADRSGRVEGTATVYMEAPCEGDISSCRVMDSTITGGVRMMKKHHLLSYKSPHSVITKLKQLGKTQGIYSVEFRAEIVCGLDSLDNIAIGVHYTDFEVQVITDEEGYIPKQEEYYSFDDRGIFSAGKIARLNRLKESSLKWGLVTLRRGEYE